MIGPRSASPAAPAATKMLRAASGPYAEELRPSSPSAGTPSATPISRERPSPLASGRPLRKRARTLSGDAEPSPRSAVFSIPWLRSSLAIPRSRALGGRRRTIVPVSNRKCVPQCTGGFAAEGAIDATAERTLSPTERSRRARCRISERKSRLVEFQDIVQFRADTRSMRCACTLIQIDKNRPKIKNSRYARTSRVRRTLQVPRDDKCPLTIEIENAKIVGFVQILHGNLEMAAISLLRHREGHLVGDELLDALCPKFSMSAGSVNEACDVTITSGPLPVIRAKTH